MVHFKSIITDFYSLVFPNCCAGCGKNMVSNEKILCTLCRLDMPRTNHIKNVDNNLKIRFAGRINFEYAVSYAKYSKSGIVGNMLKELKYHGNKEVGELIGELLGNDMVENGYANQFDVIVPVPLHSNKLIKRGYNQAEVFAQYLSNTLGCKLDSKFVVRSIFTKSQTNFSGEARWNNVKDIFKVINPENITGKRILLTDDVVTTGATIESLVAVIMHHNPRTISLATIADADI